MKSSKPHRVAEVEAREEVGITGQIGKTSSGSYTYNMQLPGGKTVPCRVAAYVLIVTGHLQIWREQDQRDVQWVGSEAAAELVQEPKLAAMIRDLARLNNVVPGREPVANPPGPADVMAAANRSASSLITDI